MRKSSRRQWLIGGSTLAVAAFCPQAEAGAEATLGYTRPQVYSAALRYLRIDLGYEVTEKNPDAAYLLFEYVAHDQRQASFGAFEIIETTSGVRLAVKLPKMPGYHESVLRDGLVKKLREDYGEPPKSPPKPSTPPETEDPESPKEAPEDDADLSK